MDLVINLMWIKGIKVGIEYEEDEDAFYVALDLGILRLMFIKTGLPE